MTFYGPIEKPNILTVMENEGVELRQRGRDWWALCPFHADKSPSLKISVDRQAWYCFGCGEHGDVVDFIRKRHGIGFKEALRILGIRRGRPAPVDPAKVRAKERKLAFEAWRSAYYSELCRESIELNSLRVGFAAFPHRISEQTAWTLAQLLGELPKIEYCLDILAGTDDEQKFELFKEAQTRV